MSNNRAILQEKVNGQVANILGWVTALAMTMAAVALLFTLFLSSHVVDSG
jgi:hypothetical protein